MRLPCSAQGGQRPGATGRVTGAETRKNGPHPPLWQGMVGAVSSSPERKVAGSNPVRGTCHKRCNHFRLWLHRSFIRCYVLGQL